VQATEASLSAFEIYQYNQNVKFYVRQQMVRWVVSALAYLKEGIYSKAAIFELAEKFYERAVARSK
jgi:hypothetical protein